MYKNTTYFWTPNLKFKFFQTFSYTIPFIDVFNNFTSINIENMFVCMELAVNSCRFNDIILYLTQCWRGARSMIVTIVKGEQ